MGPMVRGRGSPAHAIIVSASLPVGPDSRNNLDVGKVWELLRQREGVCAIALRIALRKVNRNVPSKSSVPSSTYL